MKVWNRKKVLQPFFNPPSSGDPLAFGTVPVAARVIRRLPVSAGIAHLHVIPKGGRSTVLDIEHHSLLLIGKIVARPILRPMEPEDIGKLTLSAAFITGGLIFEGEHPRIG